MKQTNQNSAPANSSPAPNIGFFGLPPEVRAKFIDPILEIIDLRGEVPDKANPLAPGTYRLVINADKYQQPVYSLGFYKKSESGETEYAIEQLDVKSAFYRVITQDFDFISNTKQNPRLDRFALHYLEEAVNAQGGTIKHRLHDRIRLAKVYFDRTQWEETEPTSTSTYTLFFEKTVKEELFQDFLFYVALGEQDRAESILKHFPEFMLSKYKSDVKSVSKELTFHTTTALKLAVRNADWHMYKMMLKYIPPDKHEEYGADLRQQLKDFEKNGLPYTLDNLSVCGLRVLEAGKQEPTEKQIQTAREGNLYHLILHRDARAITSAELGFRDSDGEYRRHPLPEGGLRNFVLNADNALLFQRVRDFSHKIARQKKVLNLAEPVINRLGGETKISDNKTLKDHIDLLARAFDVYVNLDDNNFSSSELAEQSCVVIGRLQRLCFVSPNFAQYWMSDEFGWWNIRDPDFKKGSARLSRPLFYDGASLFPFDSSFADNYLATGLAPAQMRCLRWAVPPFLRSFYRVAFENLQSLNRTLEPRTSLFPNIT